MIEIFAVSYNGQPAAANVRGSFGPEGGTLGRGPDNRLPLPDPARHVSRLQAKVRHDGARFWICNTSDANPLFLNDEEIESGRERPLVPGDELRVGLYVLRVRTPVGPSVDYRPAGGLRGEETLAPNAAAAVRAAVPAPASIESLLGGGGAGGNPFADLLQGSAPLGGAPGSPVDLLGGHPGVPPVQPSSRPGAYAPAAAAPAPPPREAAPIAPARQAPPAAAPRQAPPPAAARQAPPTAAPAPDRADDSIGGLLGSGPASPSAGSDPFADLLAPAAGIPAPGKPSPEGPPSGARPVSTDPFAALSPTSTNPFADLLGPAAPSGPSPSKAARPAVTHIPDDFNPFAAPAAPSRNTSDPLGDLAKDGIDLASLGGEKRATLLDFDPSSKVDPRDVIRGGTPSLVDPLHAVDPMQLFGGPEDRLLAGGGDAVGGIKPMRDDMAQLGANFTPPRALHDPNAPVREPSQLPSQQIGPDTIARPVEPRAAAAPARHAPAGMPGDAAPPLAPRPPESASEPLPMAPPPGAGRPSADVEPARRPTAPPAPPAPPYVPPAPAGMPQATATGGAPAASAALLAAFLEGAHAEALNVPNGLTPDMMRMLGRLVYHAVAGAMTLISARQITKREMGAEVTMIVPKGNNPLKFLPTPEAALMQILGPKMPGFMTSVDAMEDAFEDLRAHEVGVIAGTRAALGEVLRRFDPKVLEKRLGGGGMLDSVLPGGRRAKLWASFEAQFNEVYREAEDDFNKLFGQAFITAYEAEVARHRGPR